MLPGKLTSRCLAPKQIAAGPSDHNKHTSKMGIHAYDDDRVEHTTLSLITHEQSIVIKVNWTRTTSIIHMHIDMNIYILENVSYS